MGDPKKQRKKYATPSHPWQGDRIEAERKLMSEYGLKNKKELWKMNTLLRDIKMQAKSLINRTDEESKKQTELFLNRLARLGIIKNVNTKLEDVLDLDAKSILERRLQTLFFRKGHAKSVKQARQFILHGHAIINKSKMDISSYIVPVEEEASIDFSPLSPLSSSDHPERKAKETQKEGRRKAEHAPEAEEKTEEAAAAASEE